MYCRKCGTLNEENAYQCTRCGEFLHGESAETVPVKIPSYLAQSILVTLFCCIPLGIPAIVYSAQVNSKIQAGDIAGAMESSRKAKLWAWWSFGAGLLVGIIYFFLAAIGAMV